MKKSISLKMTAAIILVLLAALILLLVVHSSLAYLARKKTAANTFSVGLVELTIEEANFPEENPDRWLVPKSFLPKDPRIVNTGSVDVYAFAEVTVPYDEVLLILDSGENINMPDPQGRKNRELFNLFSDDTEAVVGSEVDGFRDNFTVTENGVFTYDHNWVFLGSSEDTENLTHTYLFGYCSVLTTEEEHQATTCIFDRIQLINMLEGDLSEENVRTITVKAFGIQSEELKGSLVISDPQELTKEEIQNIYRYYQNQEG